MSWLLRRRLRKEQEAAEAARAAAAREAEERERRKSPEMKELERRLLAFGEECWRQCQQFGLKHCHIDEVGIHNEEFYYVCGTTEMMCEGQYDYEPTFYQFRANVVTGKILQSEIKRFNLRDNGPCAKLLPEFRKWYEGVTDEEALQRIDEKIVITMISEGIKYVKGAFIDAVKQWSEEKKKRPPEVKAHVPKAGLSDIKW